MKNEGGDSKNNFGAVVFVILISLFAFTFDGKSDNNASDPAHYSLQPDLSIAYYSSHSDAVISDTPHLSSIVTDCGYSLNCPNLNSFNLNYKILDYNRKIAQNIFLAQKTRLLIQPPFVWKYSFHLAQGENEDLPVLS